MSDLAAVIESARADFARASTSAELEDAKARFLGKQGLVARGGPPERLAELIARDRPRWAKVVRDAEITSE